MFVRLFSSVCPSDRLSSVHMEQLRSHWKDFHEVWYLSIFRKSFEKICSFFESWRQWRVLCMKRNVHFMIISHWILLRIRNTKDKNFRESKHTFYVKSYRLCNNVEKYCRTRQATDDNTAHAHCMLDAEVYKYALIIRNTTFPLQQWLQERTSISRYTYITYPVFSYLQ